MSRLASAFRDRQRYWIALFILLGCGLRLIWPGDMKWKADEIWMYVTATEVVSGKQPWPWLGMPTSVGFLNPGLSIWSFIGLRWLSRDAIELVRWVQLSNVAAIVLLAGFIRRYVPRSEQNIWLWGLAVASVNPLAVHFSRALWSTDLLPFVGFFLFVGHWWRDRRWGAFIWGLIGSLIGQIHMSGFFWQGSLVLWELWRRRQQQQVTRWTWWLGGSILGCIPLLPWLAQMGQQAVNNQRPSWAELLTPNFHIHWLITSWGVNLENSFGQVLWRSWYMTPRIGGVPTFGVAILLLFLALSGLFALGRSIWHGWRGYHNNGHQPDRFSDTALSQYIWPGAIIMPLLLLLARVRIPAQYLIILFPFPYTWVAWLLRHQRRWLIAVCWAQFALTVMFLIYVHQNGGIIDGNYGPSYFGSGQRLTIP